MSTTEALRTQLDALQRQFYEVQAENRKLKEQNPQRAEMLELEELAQTREENVRLAQEISELRERGQQETQISEIELSETNARLESEIGVLRRTLCEKSEELSSKEAALEREKQRTKSAEEDMQELQETLDRVQCGLELERLRAVAAETWKWEEREARLVRRVEELERQAMTIPELSGGAGGDGGEWETRRGSTSGSSKVTAPTRYASSTNILCGGGEALIEPCIGVADKWPVSGEALNGDTRDKLSDTVRSDTSDVVGNGPQLGASNLNVSSPEFLPPRGVSFLSIATTSTTGRSTTGRSTTVKTPVTTPVMASGCGRTVAPQSSMVMTHRTP